MKKKVTEVTVLVLPDFGEVFVVHCDASSIGIGGILSQKNKPCGVLQREVE